MKVTIICEDKDVEMVRERAKEVLPNHNTMIIPASQTGKSPATHWVCKCEVSEDMYEKMKSLQKYSQIIPGDSKLVLEEINLKIIK